MSHRQLLNHEVSGLPKGLASDGPRDLGMGAPGAASDLGGVRVRL